MYIVTKTGQKIQVDDTQTKDLAYFPFQQQVALYDDTTVLRDIWLVTGQREECKTPGMNDTYEFVAEKKYDHEPTKEEILWFMSANGLTRYDIVTISKGYTLDMEFGD